MELTGKIVPQQGKTEAAKKIMVGLGLLAQGGWGNIASDFVKTGADKMFCVKNFKYWGSKRRRKKRVKKALQHAALDTLFESWEYKE